MGFMEELKNLGVNVDEGVDRVLGDSSLYAMMLGMFVDAVANAPITLEEFSGSNLDGLIQKVHTLKGTAGNLSLTPLFTGYNQTLGLLRGGLPSKAREEFARIQPIQAKIIDCIKRNMG